MVLPPRAFEHIYIGEPLVRERRILAQERIVCGLRGV